jgi:hypothetical protein
MLVRKKKEHGQKKKKTLDSTGAEDTLQSLRSWIRKIEQTTTSVSSRLSAVEKRLSGGSMDSPLTGHRVLEGPVETFLRSIKKENVSEAARVLDGEIAFLHNELVSKQLETDDLKTQLEALETTNTVVTEGLQGTQAAISELKTAVETQMKQSRHHEPLVMHLGALEFPVEFTGIIGGSLAFVIAFLVLINQKEILLSPVFLVIVGLLLLGFAMVKMVRSRSRALLSPSFGLPLDTPSGQITPVPCERKQG